jgi:hypothetical protein
MLQPHEKARSYQSDGGELGAGDVIERVATEPAAPTIQEVVQQVINQ